MNLDPTDIYERLVKGGEEWADAQAAAELLEESKKTLVSQLGADSGLSSATAREAYAYAHDDYIDHVQRMVEARKHANKCKVRYDSAKIWAELLRTKNANERAAMGRAT